MHSTVREQAGIGFEGGEYAESFVLADVRLTGEAPHRRGHPVLGEGGPDRAWRRCPAASIRIVAPVADAPEEPSAPFVQQILDTAGSARAARRSPT